MVLTRKIHMFNVVPDIIWALGKLKEVGTFHEWLIPNLNICLKNNKDGPIYYN